MAKWTFAPNPMGEVEGPNNAGISAFTSDRAGSLVRELLQNSLDARADAAKPVSVSFQLEDLPADSLDLYGLRQSLEAAIASQDNDDRHRKQFRRGLGVLKDAIQNRAVPALAITDSNTTGAPDDNGREDKWRNLTKSQGKSQKDATDAGGSFGIGKHAAFAATDLRTVLYSTAYAAGGGGGGVEKRFTGKSILVSHTRGGCDFRSVGWLESDGNSLADSAVPPAFALDSPGTRIAILGYKRGRSEDAWRKRTAREVITHFFHAVSRGGLRVRVGDETVSADTLDRWLDELGDDNLKERVAVSRMPPTAAVRIDGIGEVNLRVRVNDDDNRAKTLVFVRDAGMMLTDKLGNLQLTASRRMIGSFPRRWKGFIAIVECLSAGGRSLLREAEAPSHDKVSPDNADESERAAVREALRELGKWVHAEIGKLAAPPEVGDSQSAEELTPYLPLESENGSTGDAGATRYEIAPPVKAERAPRNLGARRGKGGTRRIGGNGKGGIVKGGKGKRGNGKKRGNRNRASTEPVLQPLSDLRRLRHSLQWPDHSVRFAFDKPEGKAKRIELYAKGEMGKDERVGVERAYHDGRRLKVKDGAVVDVDFDSIAGDRVQLEFKTIRPISDKRVEITAVL